MLEDLEQWALEQALCHWRCEIVCRYSLTPQDWEDLKARHLEYLR